MTRTAGVRGGGLFEVAATYFVLLLLASCVGGAGNGGGNGGGSDPPSPPRDIANETMTIADHDTTVRLRVGETAMLSLANPITADPEVSDDAIRLDAIANIAESPTQQWEIHAVRPGTAQITATDGQGRPFALTVDVVDS